VAEYHSHAWRAEKIVSVKELVDELKLELKSKIDSIKDI
jgi:hypothetical protein